MALRVSLSSSQRPLSANSSWALVGRLRPHVAQVRPNLDKVDQIWPPNGQARATLGPTPTNLGRARAKSCRRWPELVPDWLASVQSFVQAGASLAQHWSKWGKFGRFRPTAGHKALERRLPEQILSKSCVTSWHAPWIGADIAKFARVLTTIGVCALAQRRAKEPVVV